MNSTTGLGALLAPHQTRDIAKVVGVSTATVTNWRSGRTRPDRRHWSKLCKFTNVDMHDMISIVGNDPQLGKADEIGGRIMRLPQKDRLALITMLARLEDKGQKGQTHENRTT